MNRYNDFDWNTRLEFLARSGFPEYESIFIPVSITYLEVFIGLGAIIKAYSERREVRRKYDQMLLGFTDTYHIPDSIYEVIVGTFVSLGLIECTDEKIEFTVEGVDFYLKNWMTTDMCVYTIKRWDVEAAINIVGSEKEE